MQTLGLLHHGTICTLQVYFHIHLTNQTKILQCFQILSANILSSTSTFMWFSIRSSGVSYILITAIDKNPLVLKRLSDMLPCHKALSNPKFWHPSSISKIFCIYVLPFIIFICVLILILMKSSWRCHLLVPKLLQRVPCRCGQSV